jgi:hypothetical protein
LTSVIQAVEVTGEASIAKPDTQLLIDLKDPPV